MISRSLVSVMLVLISALAMCLNTTPEFKLRDEVGERTVENPVFAPIEACCISWFTLHSGISPQTGPANVKFLKRRSHRGRPRHPPVLPQPLPDGGGGGGGGGQDGRRPGDE